MKPRIRVKPERDKHKIFIVKMETASSS